MNNVSPAQEIQFKHVQVTILRLDHPSKVAIRWILQPTMLNIRNYTFIIERSENSASGFEIIGQVEGYASIEFLDYTTSLHSIFRNYYYRVTARNNLSGKVVVAPVVSWDGELDLKCIEMVRLLDLELEIATGTPIYAFNMMSVGARCPICWDPATSRVMDPDCPSCKGTGIFGGYYNGIYGLANFSPSTNITKQADWGEVQENQTDVLLNAHPVVGNKDVLIQADSNRAFVVEQRKPIVDPGTTGTLVHQLVRVMEINRSDIENKLTIPEEVRRQATEFMAKRKEQREW